VAAGAISVKEGDRRVKTWRAQRCRPDSPAALQIKGRR
jgi:hypothetical protein